MLIINKANFWMNVYQVYFGFIFLVNLITNNDSVASKFISYVVSNFDGVQRQSRMVF